MRYISLAINANQVAMIMRSMQTREPSDMKFNAPRTLSAFLLNFSSRNEIVLKDYDLKHVVNSNIRGL